MAIIIITNPLTEALVVKSETIIGKTIIIINKCLVLLVSLLGNKNSGTICGTAQIIENTISDEVISVILSK